LVNRVDDLNWNMLQSRLPDPMAFDHTIGIGFGASKYNWVAGEKPLMQIFGCIGWSGTKARG
jgi:hypothetical protein